MPLLVEWSQWSTRERPSPQPSNSVEHTQALYSQIAGQLTGLGFLAGDTLFVEVAHRNQTGERHIEPACDQALAHRSSSTSDGWCPAGNGDDASYLDTTQCCCPRAAFPRNRPDTDCSFLFSLTLDILPSRLSSVFFLCFFSVSTPGGSSRTLFPQIRSHTRYPQVGREQIPHRS